MFYINKKNIVLIVFLFMLSFSFTNFIYAAENLKGLNLSNYNLTIGAIETNLYQDTNSDKPTDKVIKYIGWILNLVFLFGYLLIVRIVWAGYLWMTAQGNAEQVEDAKKVIRHAILGIVILFSLYAISYFVIDSLIKVSKYQG